MNRQMKRLAVFGGSGAGGVATRKELLDRKVMQLIEEIDRLTDLLTELKLYPNVRRAIYKEISQLEHQIAKLEDEMGTLPLDGRE